MNIQEAYQNGKEKLSETANILGNWIKENSNNLVNFGLASLTALTLSGCSDGRYQTYKPNSEGLLERKGEQYSYGWDISEKKDSSKIVYDTEPHFNPKKKRDYNLSGLKINGEDYHYFHSVVWEKAENRLDKIIDTHFEARKEKGINALEGGEQ